MPTYEYVCTECGEPLEIVQSIHDDSLTVCPNCGGKLRKLFGNVGVVFKGSGFYKTDSRKPQGSGAKSSSSSSSSTASDSSAKSDSAASTSSSDSGTSSSASKDSGSASAPAPASKPAAAKPADR